jgi:hypothetical protein
MAARRPGRRIGVLRLVLVAVFLGGVGGCPAPGTAGAPPDVTAPPPESVGTTEGTGGPPQATEEPDRESAPPPASTNGEGAVPPRSEGPGDGTEPAATPSDPALQGFLDDCEAGVREWRAGQVSYPGRLAVDVGETVTYVATVDVRTTPEATDDRIPGPSPTGDPVFVRCEVAARLTPIGTSLTIDDEDWVLRSFTPSGVIRWTWAVTAAEADDADLRLEMQPAVVGEGGILLVGDASTEVSSFLTPVSVEQGRIARIGEWWSDNWGTVSLIAAGLAAAVLGVLRFGEQLARRLRRVVAAWQGLPVPPERSDEETDETADAAGERAPGAGPDR